ncbi:hypothetical protein SAMN05421678_101352 [Actinopolymorpha cephalotaxi]|uniref:Uncharacterized protein n=1 Tax=Actinopolymorpha cephalotaxi TaxID=504797 RepID=A0A1I2KLG0_9ACTN|nr:hypothetical protein [Actinopolymorpha cephalotaxi]NYH84495.1 hypothetical protein [Actinopolymorpha cephalotaxi]SFF67168.1 hypothetical protein SAMN05421678_101352 [Actinopolymorpha cephalotaxi]
MNMSKWTWKQILVVTVVALAVISIARSFLPSSGGKGDAVDLTGQGSGRTTEVKVPEVRQPTKIVRFNGHKVPVGAGPVAVLNPALAKPGGQVGVNGSGFDKGARVDVMLSTGTSPAKATGKGKAKAAATAANKGRVVASARANRDGVVNANFTYPVGVANQGGKQIVTLAQVGSTTKVAKAQLAAQSGVGLMSLSDEVGTPGTQLQVDAEGFAPNEPIRVYWGRISGVPSSMLRADPAGRLSHASLRVGVGAVGQNTVILVGAKSKTTALAPFQLLRQYPMVLTKPFSARANQTINLTGKGFAPNERVLGYFNSPDGTPVMTMRAADNGTIGGVGFKVPYGLFGRQSLVFVGEQSRASTKTGFLAQKYQPSVRTSTWGGLPGTMLNFYAKGFAPNEAVHVFVQGQLVAAFRVNEKGSALAAGTYTIPADAQNKVVFKLVGARSQGAGTATVTVDKSEGKVQLPPQKRYRLPADLKY